MKSKIVNFEVFTYDYKNYTIEEATYKKLTNEIDVALSQGYDSIIGAMLADGFLYRHDDHWCGIYSDIVQYAMDKGAKVTLITGGSHLTDVPKNTGCGHIKFNFNLHTVHNSYKSVSIPDYNPNTKKYLFLGGAPDRPNRIGLLYDLYKQNLLENAEWSFFPPWVEDQKERSLPYFESEEAYEKFIKFAARQFDEVYDSSKEYATFGPVIQTEWTKNSSYLDPKIFAETSLSILSEGPPTGEWNNNSFFLTEKSYKTIVQGHPFLFAGNTSMFQHLKNLGFKTFENYFPYPDYVYIKDEPKRLEVLIENLKHWLTNDGYDFVDDVNYNKKRFYEIAEENFLILKNFKEEYNVSDDDMTYFFDKKGFGHLLE